MVGLLILVAAGLAFGSPVSAATCNPGAPNVDSDFNDDGYADLAIGAPEEDVLVGTTTKADAGAVNVLYGSSSGPQTTAPADQLLWQGNAGIGDVPNVDDLYGHTLASGDFNGDGCKDLAVGTPYEAVGGHTDAGAVNVIYGCASGLSASGTCLDDQVWHQDLGAVGGVAESHDHFGWALAAGNFDGDAYDDLAIGIPGEDVGSTDAAGMVSVLYGRADNLAGEDTQNFHKDSANVPGSVSTSDLLGYTLAAANFNGDSANGRSVDDLAVGVPNQDLKEDATQGTAFDRAGAVVLFAGSTRSGQDHTVLTAPVGAGFISQAGINGIGPGSIEALDKFAVALSAGDFDDDGFADLAVGTPLEDEGPYVDTGSVSLIAGSATEILDLDRVEYWTQQTPDVRGVAEDGDKFGWSLATGDLDANGNDDLAIGAPWEEGGTPTDAGCVNILFGGSQTFPTALLTPEDNDQLCDNTAAEDEQLGYAVRIANFNGDTVGDDLAAGIPKETVGGDIDAGSVDVWVATTASDGSPELQGAPFRSWTQDSWPNAPQPGGEVEGTAEADDLFGWSLG